LLDAPQDIVRLMMSRLSSGTTDSEWLCSTHCSAS
jgi:hypothetical protein